MDSPNFFYKVNLPRLIRKSELKGVYFRKPRLVGYYDKNYDSLEPAKRILYFKEPKVENYPIDLNAGYDTYIKLKPSTVLEALETTLIYDMKAQISVNNIDKAKVFTSRSTLVTIMESYYSKFGNWSVRVSRYNGNLYMIYLKVNNNKLKLVDTHHGQLIKNVFTESLNDEPKINKPADVNKRLIGVYQSSFGKYDMIYHGEIQGIQAEEEIKDFDDLEALNACRFVMVKQIWANNKRDSLYLKHWLHTYLANVRDIYIAYKNKAGIVDEPIIHKLASELSRENKWKPGICTEFLYEFLEKVDKLMSEHNINCLNTVYEFYYDREDLAISYKVFKGKTEKIFITQEYLEYCNAT